MGKIKLDELKIPKIKLLTGDSILFYSVPGNEETYTSFFKAAEKNKRKRIYKIEIERVR